MHSSRTYRIPLSDISMMTHMDRKQWGRENARIWKISE